MREELEELFHFLMERKDDERINIQKEIKYGHRNYWITFDIDEEPSQNNSQNHWGRITGRLALHFDCRNECIVISSDTTDINSITFEDIDLVKKCSAVIEEHLSSTMQSRFRSMVEHTFSSCHKKDVHRDWKMKKIFDDEDESI
jgi:hypothetical protein